MPETRARRRIRQAVEGRGYAVVDLDWEPWYDAGEMSGLAGGWALTVDRDYVQNTTPGDDLYGLSVEELLAEIDYWLKPADPCDCDRTHAAMQAARIVGDPQKPTHEQGCRFHIRYRLPWWPKSGDSR